MPRNRKAASGGGNASRKEVREKALREGDAGDDDASKEFIADDTSPERGDANGASQARDCMTYPNNEDGQEATKTDSLAAATAAAEDDVTHNIGASNTDDAAAATATTAVSTTTMAVMATSAKDGVVTHNTNSGASSPAAAAAAADGQREPFPSEEEGRASSFAGPYILSAPGAYPVMGPGFRRNDDDANIGDAVANGHEEEAVFDGFLPAPASTSREQRLRYEAREMLRTAITLDESMVRKIDDGAAAPNASSTRANNEEGVGGSSNSGDEVGIDSRGRKGSDDPCRIIRMLRSHGTVIVLTLILLAAIALGVALGANSEDQTTQASSSCPNNQNQDRYAVAKDIASGITPSDVLEDAASPQHRALEWIACQDAVSSRLIDGRDPSTNVLPTQAHGTASGGKSGEAHLLRRYALATFYFATSTTEPHNGRPWKDALGFLDPDAHECAWHVARTRSNFPFGDIDPVGYACTCGPEMGFELLRDDVEAEICDMWFNFRVQNEDIAGTLPPEIGHIEGLTKFHLEQQEGLSGSIPPTIGNLPNLISFSILFSGPDFGGEIPSSLFESPTLEYITFKHNRGVWTLPASPNQPPGSKMIGLFLSYTGMSGTIPSFISELKSLKEIDLAVNSLEGPIPDSLGSLESLSFLSLYDNGINGTLPQSLGQLPAVTAMSFGKNKIEGPIPSSLGSLDKLQLLDLSYNRLEGTVPAEFSKMTSLKHILLQHNANLNGSISPLEPLGNLSSLLLYSNSFSSTIPITLFSRLTGQRLFADFGHNKFTGKLPERFSWYAKNTSYLAIMGNDFDVDAVDHIVCEETRILHADCSSCSCCKSCCGDKSNEEDPNCYFDLDFYQLTGLELGAWWHAREISYYEPSPQV